MSDSPLAMLRKRKGLKQYELAERIGITPRYLRSIERGDVLLSERLEGYIIHVLDLDRHEQNELWGLPRNDRH